MTLQINRTPALIRAAFASAAILSTVLITASIGGLAQHYGALAQAAGVQPVAVAAAD